MTPEQQLLGALGVLTSALTYCVRMLFAKAALCESDREQQAKEIDAIRREMGNMRQEQGVLQGQLIVYQSCSSPTCQFRKTPQTGTTIPRP